MDKRLFGWEVQSDLRAMYSEILATATNLYQFVIYASSLVILSNLDAWTCKHIGHTGMTVFASGMHRA